MRPRKSRLDIVESHELISKGRQALMSCVSPEFIALETVTGFLIVRNAPRMRSAESASRPF